MRKFIWILIFTVLAGCSVEKRIAKTHRLIEKYPETLEKYITVKDSVVFKDTTIYRDTTIYDTIPGEHRIDSVEVPCPDVEISPLEVTMSYVKAKAWLSEGNLYLDVDMPPMVLKHHLDSAISERDMWRGEYHSEILKPPPKKITPKWAWFVLGIALVEFVLLALTLLLRR